MPRNMPVREKYLDIPVADNIPAKIPENPLPPMTTDQPPTTASRPSPHRASARTDTEASSDRELAAWAYQNS